MLTSLADGRIWADRFGDSEPSIIALHGWGRSRHDWKNVVGDRAALAVDLPGFGASPAPDSAWDTADYADLLVTALSGIDRPLLVGHSFGGRVAVQVVARHPGLVSGLVLTGVPLLRLGGPSRRPAPRYRAARWLHRRGIVSDARMEKLRQRYGSADYRAAQGVMRDVLVSSVNEDYRSQLAAVREQSVPTSLVWGEDDTTVPLTVAQESLALLGPEATLDVVPGSGHLIDDSLAARIGAAIDDVRARSERQQR